MREFEVFDELNDAVEKFTERRGTPPQLISVSRELYRYIIEAHHEHAFVVGDELIDPSIYESVHGPLQIVVDEMLSNFEVVAE